MFRTRREAKPQFGGHYYPNGGHNHGTMGVGFDLYNEDNLHLQNYPRHANRPYEHHQQQSVQLSQHDHLSSHRSKHHHNPPSGHHQYHNQHY